MRRNPWHVLAVLCLANFLVLLDTTIVNTAAPNIVTTLDTGLDQFLWVLNSYLIAFAALLVVCGRLGDLFGQRALFLSGLGVFTAASILCALASTSGELVAARIGQGVGAAMLVPQALAMIVALFPANKRGAAFGIFTAVAGIAAMSGPTLGGLLVTEFGWRSVFWLNVPVGLLGLIAAGRLVPRTRRVPRLRLDLTGMVLATAALVTLIYAIVDNPHPVVFAGSVLLLALFLLWERRHPQPLLPFRLYRIRGYTVSTVVTFITSFSLNGFLLVYVIDTQVNQGMSPLQSGLWALPWTVALSLVAPVAGRFADKLPGRAVLIGGLIVYAAGVFAFQVTDALVVPLLAIGIGQGAAIAPTTTEAMRRVPEDLAGAASGVLNTARQVGAAMGTAVTGAIVQTDGAAALNVVTVGILLGAAVATLLIKENVRKPSATTSS